MNMNSTGEYNNGNANEKRNVSNETPGVVRIYFKQDDEQDGGQCGEAIMPLWKHSVQMPMTRLAEIEPPLPAAQCVGLSLTAARGGS